MRIHKVILFGLMLLALSGPVFGQMSLPWDRPGQSNGQEKQVVLESQLPLVRAGIEGSGEIWVGQAIPLNVEVIVPTWFTGAPKFPDFEIPNALTLSPEAAVNFVVQSGGKTFSAQGRRYLIFPQAKGKYTVPSAKVAVTFALPDGTPSPPNVLSSPPAQFEACMPPGAEGAKYFLTTDRLQIRQSFDRKIEGLKAGDSITRTVSMTAENTLGMMLPVLNFEAPDGIRIYPEIPRISEKAERGRIEADRIESVTYILEREGHYTLPEITILWWNPRTKEMNKARLPVSEFSVKQTPVYEAETFASSQELDEKPGGKRTVLDYLKVSAQWVLLALGLSLFTLILRCHLSLKGISVRAYLAERNRRRAENEIIYFKRFRRASLSNDARSALREIMFWLDRVSTRPLAATLAQFVGEIDMPELSKEQEELEAFLFHKTEETETTVHRRKWLGRRFFKVAAQARKVYIRRTKRVKESEQRILCFNPEGS